MRDLPILDAQTHLLVHRVRVACPDLRPEAGAAGLAGRAMRG